MEHGRSQPDPGAGLRAVLRSTFARSVALLVSGTAIAHGLSALAAPALSRLFSPAEFGLLALFTSLTAILAEAGSARYELTICLPENDADALNLFALGSLMVGFVAAAALLAVALAGAPLAALLGQPGLAPLLWWLPPALLAIGLTRTFSFWATREKRFRALSATQVARSSAAAGTQVLLGALEAGSPGLVAGRVAGETCAAIALGQALLRREGARLRAACSWTRMRALGRAYADFPKYGLPQGLLNACSQSVAAFLLAAYFDAQIVGLYAMAHRLLHLPARFLGQAVRQVFLQRASETHRQGGDLARLFLQTTAGLAVLGLPVALIILLAGPQLFRFLLGAQWDAAGHYAQWMMIWLYVAFLNPPAVVLTQVLRRQRLLLVYDGVLFISRALVLVIAGRAGEPLTAVALFSLVGAVFNAALIVWIYALARREDRPRSA